MFGTQAKEPNYLYRQFIRNLQNGQSYPFFIRLANTNQGDSNETDSDTSDSLSQLAADINVQFSIGVNMIKDSPSLAQSQASYYLNKLPKQDIAAIELGNEPDNYGTNGYRHNPYTISNFISDYNEWSGRILPMLPSSIRFIGPSWASLTTLSHDQSAFEQAEANIVSIYDHHIYGDSGYKGTLPSNYLLTPYASTYGPNAIASSVSVAHNDGQLYRIGEINSASHGGVSGISDAFQAALWATDIMFEYANVGVDGVNWHGNVNDAYCLFGFTNPSINGKNPYVLTKLNPMYYGLLLFQLATTNSARLLPVTVQSTANVKVWATQDQNGVVRVVVLNKDESFSGNVNVDVSGYGDATTLELHASSYRAQTGVTLGGQTFDGTTDGKIRGTQVTGSISPSNGEYSVPVEPHQRRPAYALQQWRGRGRDAGRCDSVAQPRIANLPEQRLCLD